MTPEALDSLDKKALKALVLALLEQVRLLREENAALRARLAELEARAGKPVKTPDNSSLPPSRGWKSNRSDKAEAVKKPRRGRPGVARALCPTPDHVRELHAERCQRCDHVLTPADQPRAHAYDHIDLPPIRPITTRIVLRSGACPGCGARVCATPPADMPVGSPFGPGIVALMVYLHGRQMVSYNRLVEMAKGLFGLAISEGAIAAMLARAAPPFATVARDIDARLLQSPVIACDETSARVGGVTFWQWVFASPTAVAHRIAATRGAAVVAEFLAGARPKVWVSDRYGAQMGHGEHHQVCLAHLLRDARYAIEAGDKIFAPGFKFLLMRACAIGRRREALAAATLVAHERALDGRLTRLLALEPTSPAGKKLRRGIEKCRDKLFVFVTRRDVPPTNNVSERALRPSVIFRKVTNGFRSTWGATVYADICSIVATGLLEGRTALQAIREALATRPALEPG